MNSKGHLILSLIKSVLRIVGCLFAICEGNYTFAFWMLAGAEAIGIGEELVDKR